MFCCSDCVSFIKRPFVQYEQGRPGIPAQKLSVGSIGSRSRHAGEEIRDAKVLTPVTQLAGFHTKGAHQINFVAAGQTGDEDVPLVSNVNACGKSLQHITVELSA